MSGDRYTQSFKKIRKKADVNRSRAPSAPLRSFIYMRAAADVLSSNERRNKALLLLQGEKEGAGPNATTQQKREREGRA